MALLLGYRGGGGGGAQRLAQIHGTGGGSRGWPSPPHWAGSESTLLRASILGEDPHVRPCHHAEEGRAWQILLATVIRCDAKGFLLTQ
jgi:hypothetical protein